MEVEAKFSIPDERTFQQLLEASSLAGFHLGETTVVEVSDRYLDTAGRAVRVGGYACRLRLTAGGCLVTIKGLGGSSGAIHRRAEYEVEIGRPLAPQDWPPSTARDLILQLSDDEALLPLFQIEQTRHKRLLHKAEYQVAELSLDRVRLMRDDAERAIFLGLEAELLPDGSVQDLERIAAELQEGWRLAPDGRSKFERALALFEPETAASAKSQADKEKHLTPHERAIVERLARQPEVVARRARLLLAWDDGLSRPELIEHSGLSPRRARHWLSVFPQRRLGIFPQRVLEAASGGETLSPLLPGGLAVMATEKLAPPPSPAELLDKPGIEPDDPMSEAGRKTFRFHYRRMLYHEPGTRQGDDIEALHDMRVATRRMRAAFRVFGDYFDPGVVVPYLKGLKRTGRALGAVRDLDVFRDQIRAYLANLPESQRAGLDGLLAVLEARRETAREQMIAYLNSARYRRFTEAFGEFVETEGLGSLPVVLGQAEPRPYRVRHVAPMAVYERLAAVRAYDEWVSIPHPPLARLHAVRIACKRLRYTLEFFGEVLSPATKPVVKEVTKMQDHLGNLHDAVVASGILRDFLLWGSWGHEDGDLPRPDLDTPVIAPGVATYLAARQTELQRLLDTFPEAWQRLTSAEFSQMIAEAVAVL